MSRDLEPRSVIGATNNEFPTRNSSSQFSASSASGSIHHNGRIRGAPEIVIIDQYYFIAVFSSKSIIWHMDVHSMYTPDFWASVEAWYSRGVTISS